ncbi:MAG TPA: endonuclease/exonuclease/phosphatase family protein [Natronosporangium sp.]
MGRVRRSVALVACLLAAAGLLAGSRAAGGAPEGPGRPVRALPVEVLQMNLCNSGIAGCYTGRSVATAAEVIREQRPDVVALNEICEPDLAALRPAMAEAFPGATVLATFQPAYDRRTASDFQCGNGSRYGVGLLLRVPAPYQGHITYGGLFPDQDPNDPEERAWACLRAEGAFYACTTHLAYTSNDVALTQCRYLFGTAIPAAHDGDGYLPTVVAADLNLPASGPVSVRSCLPAGYRLEGDGAVQHVVATNDFGIRTSRLIEMHGSTDHPSLLVGLTGVTMHR